MTKNMMLKSEASVGSILRHKRNVSSKQRFLASKIQLEKLNAVAEKSRLRKGYSRDLKDSVETGSFKAKF